MAILVLIIVGAALSGSDDGEDTASAPDSSEDPETADDDANSGSDDSTEGAGIDEPEGDADEGTGDADSDDEGNDPSDPGLPDADDGPVPVGTAVMEDDDVVRVNSIIPNTTVNDFFAPDPGFSVTSVEVEACGGDDGFNANSLYWTAFLEDNTAADNFVFADDYPTVSLKPGSCLRGTVTFLVPDGRTVDSVVLTGALFDETARWTADGAVPVSERLAPVEQVAAALPGEAVSFGSGHTAVVKAVTDGTPPLSDFFEPDPGRQFSQLEVEVCAGDESLPVNPLYWLVFADDYWSGSAELGGSTLAALEVAPGQCVAGIVEVGLPEGATTSYVVLTNPIFDEVGRWFAR